MLVSRVKRTRVGDTYDCRGVGLIDYLPTTAKREMHKAYANDRVSVAEELTIIAYLANHD